MCLLSENYELTRKSFSDVEGHSRSVDLGDLHQQSLAVYLVLVDVQKWTNFLSIAGTSKESRFQKRPWVRSSTCKRSLIGKEARLITRRFLPSLPATGVRTEPKSPTWPSEKEDFLSQACARVRTRCCRVTPSYNRFLRESHWWILGTIDQRIRLRHIAMQKNAPGLMSSRLVIYWNMNCFTVELPLIDNTLRLVISAVRSFCAEEKININY